VIYFVVFVIIFVISFFLPRNAITTVQEQQSVQIFVLFFVVFVLYKYLQTSRRTYLRVSPDEIEFGWELYGYTQTKSIANQDIQWLSISDRKTGYRILLLFTGDDIYYYGHITEKKQVRMMERYIKSTIEKYRV